MIDNDDIQKFIACDDGWDPTKDGWDLLDEVDDGEPAQPLTLDELKHVHEQLAAPCAPAKFRQAVGDLHKRCRRTDFFNNPRFKFLREAWPLAEFVRHKPVDQVRLSGPSERWPDGQVRIGQETKSVEITVALTAGRKMGDEYKPGPKKFRFDPVENWIARADGSPDALRKVIEKKIAKGYGNGLRPYSKIGVHSAYEGEGMETSLSLATTMRLIRKAQALPQLCDDCPFDHWQISRHGWHSDKLVVA
jgi:hypothetical protein